MNPVHLEVMAKKIKIKSKSNSPLEFSLRLGKILSSMSLPIENKSNSEVLIDPPLLLIIECEENTIESSSRACLVVYDGTDREEKNIIGMVFIPLNKKQNEVARYKVQQSNDPKAYVELSFAIESLEVQQKENESVGSKSSLSEIKILHQALSRRRKKSNSEFSERNSEGKKNMLPLCISERNKNRINHIKSEESGPFFSEEVDPSYVILLKRAENSLSKEKERNSILTNLLVIEEAKNDQSEQLIKILMAEHHKRLNQRNRNIIPEEFLECKKSPQTHDQEDPRLMRKEWRSKNEMNLAEDRRIESLITERDELYKISEELYNKTKEFQTENENLFATVKDIEDELRMCLNEKDVLVNENMILREKVLSQDNKDREAKELKVLTDEVEKLKSENQEYERKFKELYRGLEEFKNDSWKAQEEMMLKDQEIANLKENLEILKYGSEHNRSGSKELISTSYLNDDKEISYSALEAFKNMSSLLVKNNLEKHRVIESLNQVLDKSEHTSVSVPKIVEEIKAKIESVWTEFEKSQRKQASIIEIRRKIMLTINSLNF